MREQLGAEPEDIIDKYCPEVIHGTKGPWHTCPLEEAIDTGRPVEREALYERSKHFGAVEKCDALKPDVLLLDISMPGLIGQVVAKTVKKQHPEIKILVVSMHEDESYLREMLQAGVDGYIPKKAADVELLAAIRNTFRGEHFIHSSMTSDLFPAFKPQKGSRDMLEGLRASASAKCFICWRWVTPTRR